MAFATTTDVGARLEETLEGEQLAAAQLLLELAQSVIAEAVGKDDAWAAALTPVPKVLRALTVDVVCRAMASPQGLQSAREELGAYHRDETYRSALSSHLLLTAEETLIARRVVRGGDVTVPT